MFNHKYIVPLSRAGFITTISAMMVLTYAFIFAVI
jgi:hypothetical protein